MSSEVFLPSPVETGKREGKKSHASMRSTCTQPNRTRQPGLLTRSFQPQVEKGKPPSDLNDASQLPSASAALPWVEEIWKNKGPVSVGAARGSVFCAGLSLPAGSAPSRRRSSCCCSPPAASPAWRSPPSRYLRRDPCRSTCESAQ